jgi:soluble lytic murein transglycosylase-like protein
MKSSHHQKIAAPEKKEASNNLQEKQEFEPLIREAGQRHGVDPALIKAVMQIESDGNPLAVSRAGAQGLMQLMPATAAELGVKNPLDPLQNIMAGTLYLRRLLDRYHGDIRLTLAAYNWGMGNLEKQPEAMPRETKDYIAKVQNQYRSYLKA